MYGCDYVWYYISILFETELHAQVQVGVVTRIWTKQIIMQCPIWTWPQKGKGATRHGARNFEAWKPWKGISTRGVWSLHIAQEGMENESVWSHTSKSCRNVKKVLKREFTFFTAFPRTMGVFPRPNAHFFTTNFFTKKIMLNAFSCLDPQTIEPPPRV